MLDQDRIFSRPSKKICILMPGHWSHVMGGAQYQGKCIIEELIAKKKYEITYITRNYNPNYIPKGYRLIKYSFPMMERRGVQRIIFEPRILLKILKSVDPDIIYQRVGCAQTGIAAYYAKMNNRKMVWHIAHEFDVEKIKITISKNIFYRLLDKIFLTYGIRNATHIIAQTSKQKKLLMKNYNRSNSVVIPNFHPIPKETLKKNNPIKVLWVANFKPLKMPEKFIQLAKEFTGDKNVEFIMIGGIQAGKKKKKYYTELINSTPNLNYLGQKTQNEVNEVMSKSHIFVNTSLREGFPNTFIQAWMRKVPVISMDVNPDGIIDQNNLGLIASNFDELKKCAKRLIEDKNFRLTLGQNGYMYAKKNHSYKNIENLIKIFEQE